MPIDVICGGCGKKQRAPDHAAGKTARCRCGASVQIPHAEAASDLAPLDLSAEFDSLPKLALPQVSQPLAAPLAAPSPLGGVAVATPAAAAQSPVIAGFDYFAQAKAQQEQARRDRLSEMPQPMAIAITGLLLPAALNVLNVVILMAFFGYASNNVVAAALVITSVIVSVPGVVAAFMLYRKLPHARTVGFVAAIFYICIFCSIYNPIAGILTIIGLRSDESIEWLKAGGT